MNKTVVVGMSGGVDSSVAAYILKEQGYSVIGATMQIWEKDTVEEDGTCCGLSAVADARMVSQKLDIPFYVLNFRKEFENKVIDYFIKEYLEGKTPNPCIACNKYIKWETMLDKSMQIGSDYIATGHYARVIKNENGRYSIKKSVTDDKDQTYALYTLTQEQLEKTLMPVGDYTKNEIREIAKKIDLRIANKKDSQEICFIEDNDYGRFIAENIDTKVEKGNFVDIKGNVLGQHKGIYHYTIGQRRGLGLALGTPMYVSDINIETNEVVIVKNEELFSHKVYVENINFMSLEQIDGEVKALGKIRYNQKASPCTIKMNGNILECTFEDAQRAITPGQSAVFYKDDCVLCGGTIIKTP